jgi:outer membrane protein OmpA-like peptidoglycan-associated protein
MRPANGVVARLEDRTPCLDQATAAGGPTATVHFQAGSAALSTEQLSVLVETLPTVRGTNGTIRVFGHGDTDTGAAKGTARFDLAAARANAVAQALIGYGIPAPRVAVGVACADTALAGASAQLFAPS